MTHEELEQEIRWTERKIAALVGSIERLSGRQVGRIDIMKTDGGTLVDLHMQDRRPDND
jgi:hypothetical protein